VFEISVLGPVEVRRDGRLVPVPGGKTSELLVRLALEAGVFVRADQLVEELWAADAVNTRRNTLQSKVAKLRRAFGDPLAIVSAGGAYELALEPSAVDALAVLRDTATAARCSRPVTTAAPATSAHRRWSATTDRCCRPRATAIG
jgi:DNA-binding SARP family transcriptional activator